MYMYAMTVDVACFCDFGTVPTVGMFVRAVPTVWYVC